MIRPRVWLGGTLAIDLATVSADWTTWLRRKLTLRKRGQMGEPSTEVPFWFSPDGRSLHVPRGWLLTPEGQTFIRGAELSEQRSGGTPLPVSTHVDGVAFGAPPFPADQPRFIDAIVRGAQANGHGGLCKAPTQSGKTLCVLEAACRLGRSTLILVDTATIARQWIESVEGVYGKGGPRIVMQGGLPLRCGLVREDRFEVAPFTVAMVQTLMRRELAPEVRAAFGTIIVDECQGVPCDSVWGAVSRFAPSYILGLTATPDRPDGLGEAIPWIVGPEIARLERRPEADVTFVHVPFKHVPVEKVREDGSRYMGRYRLQNFGQINNVAVEKHLAADEDRVNLVAATAVQDARAGLQVLVMVGIVEHLRVIAQAIRRQAPDIGLGLFFGSEDDPRVMGNPIVITTAKKAAKGASLKPPPTSFVMAVPLSDPRQAMGRVLQPQAPRRPIIRDFVDGVHCLVKRAARRWDCYADTRERAFTIYNEVWPAEFPMHGEAEAA